MARKMVIELPDGTRQMLEQVPADHELQLQERLKLYPELLPLEELGLAGPAVIVGRESSLDSGRVDLVLLGNGGDLALVEFKTGPQNPDFRECLAQLLDFGSDPGSLRCLITDRYLWPLIRRNTRAGSRALRRSAVAMLACPARRRMLMARLRRVAMTCGPVPVRAADKSSPKVTSRGERTQWSWFSIRQCPLIQAASWSGRAWPPAGW